MKIYITKYALTRGIIEVEIVEIKNLDTTNGWLRIHLPSAMIDDSFGPQEWAASRVVAVTRAEEMREAKIAPLRKQIAKLEGMSL